MGPLAPGRADARPRPPLIDPGFFGPNTGECLAEVEDAELGLVVVVKDFQDTASVLVPYISQPVDMAMEVQVKHTVAGLRMGGAELLAEDDLVQVWQLP